MDTESIRILNTLTSEFYEHNARSFSATRDHAWCGWDTCFDEIEKTGAMANIKCVVDIGCGNLRFESFLAERLDTRPEIWAIDNCALLVPQNDSVHFVQADIVNELVTKEQALLSHGIPPSDLACAFGLIHHLPGHKTRLKLLDNMLEMLQANGFGIVSFWQFMKDERIAKKAYKTTQSALNMHPELKLEENDYLLGWKSETNSFRYCHHFDDAEITAFIDRLTKNAELISCFTADGKRGNLNTYLIFQNKMK